MKKWPLLSDLKRFSIYGIKFGFLSNFALVQKDRA
jgi:hypothetical protein